MAQSQDGESPAHFAHTQELFFFPGIDATSEEQQGGDDKERRATDRKRRAYSPAGISP
jgi:hypothetical protein